MPDYVEVFPGWKRPGLIEALREVLWQFVFAVFPGWKRPGLIEAAVRPGD